MFQCSNPFVSSFSSGRWLVYGTELPSIPEVGAVCGKAARTALGGGRAMKRTSLPLLAICPVSDVNDACYFDVRDSKRPIGFSAANP
jgi:hypothetical protein